jgi:hypothetical protein
MRVYYDKQGMQAAEAVFARAQQAGGDASGPALYAGLISLYGRAGQVCGLRVFVVVFPRGLTGVQMDKVREVYGRLGGPGMPTATAACSNAVIRAHQVAGTLDEALAVRYAGPSRVYGCVLTLWCAVLRPAGGEPCPPG